jgi:hypothetical protein
MRVHDFEQDRFDVINDAGSDMSEEQAEMSSTGGRQDRMASKYKLWAFTHFLVSMAWPFLLYAYKT